MIVLIRSITERVLKRLRHPFRKALPRILRRFTIAILRHTPVVVLEISYPNRIGHLVLEPLCYLMETKLGRRRGSPCVILKGRHGFANNVIADYLRAHFFVVSNEFVRDLVTESFADTSQRFDGSKYAVAIHDTARCYEIFRSWGNRPPLFRLTEADESFGKTQLKRMGVPDGGWFVCVHVREGGYSPEDEVLQKHRNANIDDFSLAIANITKRGGWCIRVGDATMTPLKSSERVFDYALSDFKCERLDVFLAAKCRFFLGSSSGFYLVATMFGTPSALVNMTPAGAMYSLGCNDLSIPQGMKTSDGTFLRLEVMLSPAYANLRASSEFDRLGVGHIKSSPEEISDLVEEMLDKVEDKLIYSPDDDLKQEKLRAMLREGYYSFGSGARIGREYTRNRL